MTTTKIAAYLTFSRGDKTSQVIHVPRLNNGDAYILARVVTTDDTRRKWKVRIIDVDVAFMDISVYHATHALSLGWVSMDRPKFAAITDKDAEDIQKLGVPQGLIRRISGAVSLPGTPLPEDFSDRRFETIIDGIPEGSTFVSWLLEQDAE